MKVVYFAALAICIAWLSYWSNFSNTDFRQLDFGNGFSGFFKSLLGSLRLSNEKGDWGTFGDFIGGLTNPLLTFITIILLARQSLKIHQDSIDAAKREDIRNFELSFYNLIDRSLKTFSKLELEAVDKKKLKEGDAVSEIEERIYSLIGLSQKTGIKVDLKKAFTYLDEEQSKMEIYSSVRSICLIFRLINDFLEEDAVRKKYIDILSYSLPVKLINLVLISSVLTDWIFLKYPKELGYFDRKGNKEYIKYLKDAIDELP